MIRGHNLIPEKISAQLHVNELWKTCVMESIRSITTIILAFRQEESVTPTTTRKTKHLAQTWTWPLYSLAPKSRYQDPLTTTRFFQVIMLSHRSSLRISTMPWMELIVAQSDLWIPRRPEVIYMKPRSISWIPIKQGVVMFTFSYMLLGRTHVHKMQPL